MNTQNARPLVGAAVEPLHELFDTANNNEQPNKPKINNPAYWKLLAQIQFCNGEPLEHHRGVAELTID